MVTQPDKPQGRGQRLAPPAVKACALELGLPVQQPIALRRNEEFERTLRQLRADIAVVVAYGKILPPAILGIPRAGCVNVHASLLPRWRGAAPIAWAIASGDEQTGVCLMRMEEGLDTGPVYASRATPIGATETCEALSERLSAMGAQVLVEHLDAILEGSRSPQPQDDARATYARMLTKADRWLDWAQPAVQLDRHVRAMAPWPGSAFELNGCTIKVHRAEAVLTPPAAASVTSAVAGTVVEAHGDRLVVSCGQGALWLQELQRPASKRMSTREFLAGFPIQPGAVCERRGQVS